MIEFVLATCLTRDEICRKITAALGEQSSAAPDAADRVPLYGTVEDSSFFLSENKTLRYRYMFSRIHINGHIEESGNCRKVHVVISISILNEILTAAAVVVVLLSLFSGEKTVTDSILKTAAAAGIFIVTGFLSFHEQRCEYEKYRTAVTRLILG
jgi:hypothetical protein